MVHDVVRYNHELGEGPGPSILGSRDTKDLPGVAQVDITASAVVAPTTGDSGIECDAIAFTNAGHLWSHCLDSSGRFVTHDDRRNAAPGRAVESMHVTAANAACSDPDQNFFRTGSRHGNVDDLQAVVLGEQ